MPPPTTSISPLPPDGVTRVSFNPQSTSLSLTTWAGTLAIHNAESGLQTSETTHRHPLLDFIWLSNSSLATASLTGAVLTCNLTPTSLTNLLPLGKHTAAARALALVNDQILVSGGWDAIIRLWDFKARQPISTLETSGKIYALCRAGQHSVAYATSKRKVCLLDTRKPDAVVYEREPPTLSYQLRGLSVSNTGDQYVVGSTEGRVAVARFSDGTGFSFKCHRMDGMAFPVNWVAHNQKYGSFATAGGDGYIAFWDGDARKRIMQWGRWPTSVSCVDFDTASERVAVAVSYTFEEGEKDCPPDEVHVCNVDDACIVTRKAKEELENNKQANSST